MDGEVFFSQHSWYFSIIDKMIKVLFPICTLSWRVNIYVSRQGKGMKRRNERVIIIVLIVRLLKLYTFCHNCLSLFIPVPQSKEEIYTIVKK